MPAALVTAVVELSVAEAPLAGTPKTTVEPASGLPRESTTSARIGAAKAVLMAALWPLPLDTLIDGGGAKVALTAMSAVMVRLQVVEAPADKQAPPQPVKLPPGTAVAVNTTCVPLTNDPVAPVQVAP